MSQSAKCGTYDWVEGFKNVGEYSWPKEKIVIGTKSWCGGDIAA